MSNIHDLRRLALQRHKAVTRKISRIKYSNGVEVSGSDYDPRRSPDFVRTATSAQLNSYIRKLDSFNQRDVQFVPDAQHRPISVKLWQQYKIAEAKRNAAQDRNYGEFKDIVIEPLTTRQGKRGKPTTVTVDERMRMVTPLHAHMANLEGESPYKKRERASTSIASEAKLKDLIRHMKKQATKTHQDQVLKSQRNAAMQMATTIGDLGIMEGLASLSNKQFALMWKYTRASGAIKQDYEFYKDTVRGKHGVTNSEMAAAELEEIRRYIEWAKGVDFSNKPQNEVEQFIRNYQRQNEVEKFVRTPKRKNEVQKSLGKYKPRKPKKK